MEDEATIKKQPLEELASRQGLQVQEDLAQSYLIGTTINALLRLSLEGWSLEEILQKALDIIISMPSFAFEARGSIFIVGDEPEVLVMKARKGLTEPLLTACALVPFGRCLCGRAASLKKTEYADQIDERHEVSYAGMTPHGHYCVPILLSGQTIGVINLYVRAGHVCNRREEEFLEATANTLAGVIRHRQVTDELQESQRRKKAILANIPDIAWLKDKESRFIAVNEPFAKACGCKPEDLVGKTDLDVWPRALAERYRADDKEVMESGRRKQVVEPLIDSEGRASWIETIKTPIFDQAGNVMGTTGIARDITERKQAEEALEESEKRYRELYDFLPIPVCEIDLEANIVSANRAMYETFGYTAQDLSKGFSILRLFSSEDWDRVKKDMHGLIKGGKNQRREYTLMRKEGSSFPAIVISGISTFGGKNTGIKAAVVDIIIERKLSVERLHMALGATVNAIAVMVETRDPYTAGHQRRVADLARAIATEMGLAADRINGLRMAGTIHDIGKISVPAELLSKPTKLTDIEFSLIKTHAQRGYEILKDIDFPWPVARMVLEHHERIDGSGYPQGLGADKLLLESRILAVADVVEAIASHRPYRPGQGIDAALDEIAKNKGNIYDAEAADACLKLFQENRYHLVS